MSAIRYGTTKRRCLLVLLAACAAAPAAGNEVQKDSDGDVTFDTVGYASFLLEYAETKGKLTVLVTLHADYVKESKLSEDAARLQRQRLREAQNLLAQSIRSDGGVIKVIKETNKKPVFTAEVDAIGLGVLIDDPTAATIRGLRMKR